MSESLVLILDYPSLRSDMQPPARESIGGPEVGRPSKPREWL